MLNNTYDTPPGWEPIGFDNSQAAGEEVYVLRKCKQ
jgi:hypothetical protein